MTDIFSEIDDELRKEQARRLWQRYGKLIIGGAVVIVLSVAAWRGYVYWQDTNAEAQGDAYFAAERLATLEDAAASRAAFEEFLKTAQGGYPMLARFRVAALDAKAGEYDKAIATYDAVASDPSVPTVFQDLARMRAAYIAVDHLDRAAVESRILGLATPGATWRHTARELLALAAYKADDLETARKRLTELTSDAAVPQAVRQRGELFLSVITSRLGAPSDKPTQ
jgi:hypothetical protein